MQQFEKILVPVDFAAHSTEAVRRAADIALHYSASLTLLYVYEPIDYALAASAVMPGAVPEGYPTFTAEQMRDVTSVYEERLREAEREVEALGVSRVNSLLLQGPAALEIVGFARDQQFDLIVMGTHGRTGLEHLLMGSVAERVLRSASCPVLTVKLAPEASKGSAGKAA
jgi:nucleotide-binding universal stress UspA family protein